MSVGISSAAVNSAVQVATVQPAEGAVVGVAHPVEVAFAAPVTDRRAAELSIRISAPDAPTGEFVWLSDDVVQWEPDEFWPAHSTITVNAGGIKTNFQTGASVVSVADISAHTFTVSVDGEVVREMPASMGRAKYPTPTGSFTVLTKKRHVVMDSSTIGIPLNHPDGYRLDVNDAVRITWGGIFIHSAPWSVGSQGYANVSTGCINLSPANAAWYYDMVKVGDPVIIRS